MNFAVQIALIASVLIVAAGVLGIALANARNSQRSQTEQLYEKENTALGKALNRQEQENLRLQQKLDAIEQANMVLKETVSGTQAVKELSRELAIEEGKRRDEHHAQMALLKDIIAELRHARGEAG